MKILNTTIRVVNWIIVITTLATIAADVYVNIKDIEAVTNNMGYLFPMLGILIKTFAVVKNQLSIRQLIEDIHINIDRLRYSSDLGVLTKIRTTLFYQNFDYFAIATILSGTVIALIAMSAETETKLALRGIFPYNITVSPTYEIAFFMQFWTVFMCCLWILILESSIIELIRWTNVQLVVLQANFEHCQDWQMPRASFNMSKKNYNTIRNYKYFKVSDEQTLIQSYIPFNDEEANVQKDSFALRFKTCLKHYRRIIDHVKKYNEFFSILQFFSVFITCSFVCFCLFQIVLAEMLHISQYNCGWESQLNRNDRHFVVNALIQSKQPLQITAGKFFVLSLETYLKVIKNSYSYFAILNTVHGNNDNE
ncbi:GSCOCT00003840001.3-RA-CDS, partial [Cotesia congregata]